MLFSPPLLKGKVLNTVLFPGLGAKVRKQGHLKTAAAAAKLYRSEGHSTQYLTVADQSHLSS